jgi:hypothetical protein
VTRKQNADGSGSDELWAMSNNIYEQCKMLIAVQIVLRARAQTTCQSTCLAEGQKGSQAGHDRMGLEAAAEQDLQDNEDHNDDAEAARNEAQPSQCLRGNNP